jgi:Uma2 family endonuclease
MSVMTASRTELPDDRPLTIEDLDLLPDDGNRYELDDGVLVVSPAPANIHQLVASRLQTMLDNASPPGYLVISGGGLAISRTQYRIPDLVVVRSEQFDLTAKCMTSPPDLAIEVASPSTALYDRNRKKAVYAAFGIASYWIVTPSRDQPRPLVSEPRAAAIARLARSAVTSFQSQAAFRNRDRALAFVANWSREDAAHGSLRAVGLLA